MCNLCIANMIIPFFSFEIKAMIILFIPVVIVEWIILNYFLKDKAPGPIFSACFSANAISTIVGIIIYPLEMFFFWMAMTAGYSNSPILSIITVIAHLSLFPLIFYISYKVESIYLIRTWKDYPKKKIKKATFFANLATYIPIILLMIFFSNQNRDKRYEKPRRMSCASNLKQMGLALKCYAMDNTGFFPDKNGVAGLEMLRSGDYMADRRLYTCPSTNTREGEDSEPLTDNTVSYIYIGGLSDKMPPKTAILYDKPENHKDCSNVLFVDGHVELISNEKLNKVVK